MYRATLALEGLARGGATRRLLNPYTVTLAAVILEMLAEDCSDEVRLAVGCLVMDELGDETSFTAHNLHRLLCRVADCSYDLSARVISHMTSIECPDDLQDFFEDLQQLVKGNLLRPSGNDDPMTSLHKDSPLGRFLRRLLLAADQASFDSLSWLFRQCCDMTNSLHAMVRDQGSSSISCITAAHPMTDAQAERYIYQLVEQFQGGKFVPHEMIEKLVQQYSHLPQVHYLQFQSALTRGSYEEAVDFLHRYFDLSVFPPVPSSTNSSLKPSAASGIASYSLLTSAACEMNFHHADNAALCVEEAIRLAQHNGEDHVLLAATLIPELRRTKHVIGNNGPTLGSAVAMELLQPLLCRRTLQYAHSLLCDRRAEPPPLSIASLQGLGLVQSTDLKPDHTLPVPQRTWRALQDAVLAAHAPPPAIQSGSVPHTADVSAMQPALHITALQITAEMWAMLSQHSLCQLTLEGLLASNPHPIELQQVLAARARWSYLCDGDYRTALETILTVPGALQKAGAPPDLHVPVLHTAYYVMTLDAIHAGRIPIARYFLNSLANLPGGLTPSDTTESHSAKVQDIAEAMRGLDVIHCRTLLAFFTNAIPEAWSLAQQGLEMAQALRFEGEAVRFLLLKARILLHIPGSCHSQAIQIVLQCIALTKTLSHISFHVSSLLLLINILLLQKQLPAAESVLADVRRHHLQHCSKEQQAQYYLLSAQRHFQIAATARPESNATPSDDGMNVDLSQPTTSEPAALRTGLDDLQRCEQLFHEIHYLYDLRALYHLRAGVCHTYGLRSDRNRSAKQFMEAHQLLQLRTKANDRIHLDSASEKPSVLHLAAAELRRLSNGI